MVGTQRVEALADEIADEALALLLAPQPSREEQRAQQGGSGGGAKGRQRGVGGCARTGAGRLGPTGDAAQAREPEKLLEVREEASRVLYCLCAQMPHLRDRAGAAGAVGALVALIRDDPGRYSPAPLRARPRARADGEARRVCAGSDGGVWRVCGA